MSPITTDSLTGIGPTIRISRRVRQIAIFAVLLIVGVCTFCMLVSVITTSEFVGPPVLSPDGTFTAHIRESNAGATSSFWGHVYVTDERVNRRFLLFDRLTERRATVLSGSFHPCTVLLSWEDEGHLVVSYPPGLRNMTEHQPDWPDLSVTFIQEDPSDEQVQEAFQVETFRECYGTYLREALIYRLLD